MGGKQWVGVDEVLVARLSYLMAVFDILCGRSL